APVLWLLLGRHLKWKIFVPIFVLLQTGISIVGNLEVFPFPLPAMVVFYLIATLISIIPYLLDKLTLGKVPLLVQSLIFPSSMVLVLFLFGHGPSGTWGNIAYTQTSWLVFIQSVSLGGIWLIDFLIYWFATVCLITLRHGFRTTAAGVFGASFLALLCYGVFRLNSNVSHVKEKLEVAGIVANPLFIGEALLLAEYEESTTIPADIAQSDPLLQRLNKAYVNFLADPSNPVYEPVMAAMQENTDQLFQRANHFSGKDLITWSEGAFQLIKPNEAEVIERATEWAESHRTTLFLPLAVFHTGRVTPGVPFLENKIVIISSTGEILYSYFKNVPVKGLEPSFPGDGNIPQFTIDGQTVSPGICYDADFPGLIAQTGQKASGILVLPSSDWKAIAEIHGQMAVMRAIENDVTLFRPTANGNTLAVSGRGEILFRESSFDGFEEVGLDHLPVGQSSAIFSIFPNLVPLSSVIVLGIVMLMAVPKVQQWLQVDWTRADVSSASN
ncbi:MAG: nitrilase-related carbon-nitrogen hydrolase, partial [Cyclobacteriaceae bacterium]